MVDATSRREAWIMAREMRSKLCFDVQEKESWPASIQNPIKNMQLAFPYTRNVKAHDKIEILIIINNIQAKRNFNFRNLKCKMKRMLNIDILFSWFTSNIY